MIAFLGTGLMGSEFVRAFLGRGEQVQVWNRTASKARALEKDGARAFDQPADAVRGAERVHLSLSDDASVDDTLAQARAGLAPGTLIIDHTTTAPGPTLERARRLAGEGFTYVHAPVFMGPRNARDATGLMLVSGATALVERVRPILEKMTGKLLVLGEREDRAAAFKLMGNMMIVFIASGLTDVYAFAASQGIAPTEAHALFSSFNPVFQIEQRGKKMAHGDFTPTFELSMARKDVRLMMESATGGGASLSVLPAIAGLMDQAIADGLGSKDLGAIASRAVKKR